MTEERKPSVLKTKLTERKAIKEVMSLDGEQYVRAMNSLYNELGKQISIIDKERDELAKNIKETFKMRLAFIKEAWSDKEITKAEKKRIYDDYMDTSKALNQYLLDKERKAEERKKRKETFRDITLGTMVVSVSISAICLAAKGVITVISQIKNSI